MDRRLFLHSAIPAATALVSSGCGARLRSYDKPPKRSLIADRWTGYYFHTVKANYTLKLQNSHPSLFRPAGIEIPVVSSTGDATSTLPELATIPPSQAHVELEYIIDPAAQASRELRVELRWPQPGGVTINERPELVETKIAFIDYPTVRRFLERSGRFKVEYDQPYYGTVAGGNTDLNVDVDGVPVQLSIAGPNPDAAYSRVVSYRDSVALYQLVERAWPTVG